MKIDRRRRGRSSTGHAGKARDVDNRPEAQIQETCEADRIGVA
jgi:hypothetical protein